MIRRETTPVLTNSIANSAAVRPFVAYKQEPLDWAPAVESEACFVLSNGEDAIGVFEETSPRFYQVHTLFGQSCRGRRALEVAREMIDFMIPDHADAIWGATPMTNPQARWFNRKMGAQVIGTDHFECEGEVEIFFLGRRH